MGGSGKEWEGVGVEGREYKEVEETGRKLEGEGNSERCDVVRGSRKERQTVRGVML